MQEQYEVYLGQDKIGRVQVSREGLYYRFHCRCSLSGDVMFRLEAKNEKESVDLGIVVPADGQFGLDKRLPVKQFPEEDYRFEVQPHRKKLEGKFVPIYPEEPFAYLSKLEDAHMEIREDQPGIVLPPEEENTPVD